MSYYNAWQDPNIHRDRFIYLATEHGTLYKKIGISVNPHERCKTLSRERGKTVSINYMLLPSKTKWESAFEAEQSIHSNLRTKNLHTSAMGEYFKVLNEPVYGYGHLYTDWVVKYLVVQKQLLLCPTVDLNMNPITSEDIEFLYPLVYDLSAKISKIPFQEDVFSLKEGEKLNHLLWGKMQDIKTQLQQSRRRDGDESICSYSLE